MLFNFNVINYYGIHFQRITYNFLTRKNKIVRLHSESMCSYLLFNYQ